MKKIILSAAVAAMAFSTSAVAADKKGIDLDVTGQAVLYYETHDDNVAGDTGSFSQDNSRASAAVQLNLASDLGNNFSFGSQITYLGSLGLDKTLVAGEKQNTGSQGSENTTTAELALTKIYVAKKIGNTTLKAGRQELPKSLSPLAFTEGWNVVKNTFDAILMVNTDLPKTTVVGAFVTGGTGHSPSTTASIGGTPESGEAYMLTAQTKLIPMTTLTGSFYSIHELAETSSAAGIDTTAYWIDAQVKLPANLKLGLQYGNISPDNAGYADTNGYGAKLSGKVGAIGFKAIYTSVDGDAKSQVQLANVGTATKTALYSQMMYNQKAITMDNDTVVVGASYNAGSIGKFAVNYGMTTVGKDNSNVNNGATTDKDYNELDVVYKVKAGGVQYFAIAAIRDWDQGIKMNTTTGTNATADKDTIIRFWARYNF